MNNQKKNIVKASCLSILMGTISVSPLAMAKEGDAHVPGIGRIGGEHWVQRIEVSGVLEAEYGSSEDFAGKKSSDIALATVELAFNARVNDKVTAHLTFLYEEDDTAYEVDEGYIDLALGAVNVQAGLLYVPFGAYETNMVSDSLTLEIGETRESVLQAGAEIGAIQLAFYMFNGTTQETGADDTADQMGVRIAYATEGKDSSMDIGIDYINNIGDSDAITGYLDPTTDLKAYVPAQVIYANLSFGNIHVIAEYLMTDKFDSTEIAFKSKGAEITATNLEFGYSFMIAGMESTAGLALQSTDEAVALGLPKEKTLLALSINVYRDTALSFEYATSTDYDVADGGTGKDATAYTAQLAVGF